MYVCMRVYIYIYIYSKHIAIKPYSPAGDCQCEASTSCLSPPLKCMITSMMIMTISISSITVNSCTLMCVYIYIYIYIYIY